MGKRRIEITKIEDRQKRNVAFTKRRKGLFKKADDLCRLTGAEISLLVISPGGNPFTFSSSSNDQIFRFNNAIEEEEVADDGFWWDKLNPEELDSIEKLTAVRNQLLDVKEKVAKRKQELLAAAKANDTATTSTTATVVEMGDSSSLFPMDDDLGNLLSDCFDDAENWLPSIDDSGMLFEGLGDFENWLPSLDDLEG
ncbi:hypothetical protein MKX01_012380 [Papaver californicum]|nr:hypothetical protein MKX01_012364 [Papaver californicum]KAI3994123.1 hypothetical protein MKX01_012380 [Papaver californicum]